MLVSVLYIRTQLFCSIMGGGIDVDIICTAGEVDRSHLDCSDWRTSLCEVRNHTADKVLPFFVHTFRSCCIQKAMCTLIELLYCPLTYWLPLASIVVSIALHASHDCLHVGRLIQHILHRGRGGLSMVREEIDEGRNQHDNACILGDKKSDDNACLLSAFFFVAESSIWTLRYAHTRRQPHRVRGRRSQTATLRCTSPLLRD